MMAPRIVTLLLAAGCLVAGSARADALMVFGASSTTEAVRDVAREFHAKTGHDVELSFAGSSDLARQVAAGAPADIFLSADARSMDVVERAGALVPGSRRNLLSNRLVVLVRREGAVEVEKPEDLLSVGRISMADPAVVPAGVYGRAWLQGRKLWDRLQARVLPALDVRAALTTLQSGTADAAIVYQTDALIAPDLRVAYRVPLAETPSILYPVAKLRHAKGPAADAFLEFLGSPRGRAIFTRRGFLLVTDR